MAKVIFALETAASIIAAIALFSTEVDELAGLGVALLCLGPVIAWVSSLFIYGFGELIDKVTDIEFNTCLGAVRLKTEPENSEEKND